MADKLTKEEERLLHADWPAGHVVTCSNCGEAALMDDSGIFCGNCGFGEIVTVSGVKGVRWSNGP